MLLIVLCNAPPNEAPQLAETLVSEGVAACVNVIAQVQSFYRWEGELCNEVESTLIIKVAEELYPQLVGRINELHSYEVPEIIAISPQHVSKPYLDWVVAQSHPNPHP